MNDIDRVHGAVVLL